MTSLSMMSSMLSDMQAIRQLLQGDTQHAGHHAGGVGLPHEQFLNALELVQAC